MNCEAGAARIGRFLELLRAAELLGELRESDRRRIALDPASKIVDALRVGHRQGCTVIGAVVELVWPMSSVTVSVTVNVFALV